MYILYKCTVYMYDELTVTCSGLVEVKSFEINYVKDCSHVRCLLELYVEGVVRY